MPVRRKKTETSPANTVAKELTALRAVFRETNACCAARIEGEIEQIRQAVLEGGAKNSRSKLCDLRDMLTLMRRLSVKPEKGRRKDLKKIDALVGDLRVFTDGW